MIRLRNVTKAYRRGSNRLTVLHDVSLEIVAGEMVSIIGPSGSGKSTLLSILGLLDRMDGGEYELAGKNVARMSQNETAILRSRTLGFVFQAFHLLPAKTAAENVALPLYYQGVGYAERMRRAQTQLSAFGLAGWADHLPSQLSGGQCQRVAVARALISNPKILLADEPTGNLDSKNSAELIEFIATLRRQQEITVILVTHDAQIAQSAPRCVTLVDGSIISDVATLPERPSGYV